MVDCQRHTVVGAEERNRRDCCPVLDRTDTGALAGAGESVDKVVDRWMVLHELDRPADCCSSMMGCFPLGCRIYC